MNRHERRAHAAKLRGQKIGNITIIDRTEVPEGKCDVCGNDSELRPYGPRGEWICFDCAMKDEATTARKFREHVFGDTTN